MSCRWASSHMTSLLSLVMLHDAHHMTSSCNITSFICPSCLMTKLRHVITSSSCDLTHDVTHMSHHKASWWAWQSFIWALCYMTPIMTKLHMSVMTSLLWHDDLHVTSRPSCHVTTFMSHGDHMSHDGLHMTWRPSCHVTTIMSHNYGVALVSRIDKIIGLFCKRAL